MRWLLLAALLSGCDLSGVRTRVPQCTTGCETEAECLQRGGTKERCTPVNWECVPC